MLYDIDFFKPYNDHYGHLAGDEILRRVASTISEHLRSGDTAYRYGGEEFLVILPEQSLEHSTHAAERLRRAVEELAIPHEAQGEAEVLTISAGVAELTPTEPKSGEELLREADAALYRAKESGRNRVRVQSGSL